MKAGIFNQSIKGKAEIKFIEEIFPNVFKNEILLSNLSYHDGGIRYDEMVFLASIVNYINPKKVFEFGTCKGRTTVNLCNNCKDVDKIYTLNLEPSVHSKDINWLKQDYLLYEQSKNEIGTLFKDSIHKNKVFQLWGDSIKFDFTDFSNIDFVFIDANKSYEYVYKDSQNAFDMLANSGIIIWHDYNYADGVTKAVDDFAEKMNIKIYNIYKSTLGVYVR